MPTDDESPTESIAETLIGMIVLSAARERVVAARLLNQPTPPGYFYLWGAIVWHTKEPEWVSGLWETAN